MKGASTLMPFATSASVFKTSNSVLEAAEKLEGFAGSSLIKDTLGALSELRILNIVSGMKTITTAALSPYLVEP